MSRHRRAGQLTQAPELRSQRTHTEPGTRSGRERQNRRGRIVSLGIVNGEVRGLDGGRGGEARNWGGDSRHWPRNVGGGHTTNHDERRQHLRCVLTRLLCRLGQILQLRLPGRRRRRRHQEGLVPALLIFIVLLLIGRNAHRRRDVVAQAQPPRDILLSRRTPRSRRSVEELRWRRLEVR